MKAFPTFLLSIALLLTNASDTFANSTLIGRVRERGTRKPLAGVNVFLLPLKKKYVTDLSGKFEAQDLPAGELQVVINLPGYLKLEETVTLDPKQDPATPLSRSFIVERQSYRGLEIVTTGKELKRDDSVRSLRQDQFLTLPGSGGDPVKAVQNLPGVNRAAGFSSQVIIQGSGPQDTRYQIDGHEVPIIFHAGGFSSVLFPESIERVDYLAAGYGPEYGRAVGGLVGVWTRQPQTDRFHGLAFVDLINSGLMVEGPVGKDGGFLLSGRVSYVGPLFKLATKNNEKFNFTVAPSFNDLSAMYTRPLGEKVDFKLLTVASSDTLEFLLPQPAEADPTIRGDFETATQFFRVIPQLTFRHSEKSTSRLSLGIGRDWIKFVNGDNYLRIQSTALTVRGEVERKFTSGFTSLLGWDNQYNWANVSISLPNFGGEGGVSNPLSVGERRKTTVSARLPVIGLYWRNLIKPEGTGLTLSPNARFEVIRQTQEVVPAPRLNVRYDFDPSFHLRTAGGLYYQPPQPGETDETFGNPNLKSPRAWHVTLGAEKDFREGAASGLIAGSDLFYRRFDRLVVRSVTDNYDNSGTGHAYGIQNDLRWEGDPFSLRAIYTLSRSRRWSPSQGSYRFQYDQTHLLGLIGSYREGNWKFSVRFRYATGNGLTPVVGSYYDADSDVYVPLRGDLYSDRLPAFYQLDVRIDKKWIFDDWILSAYLDVQNITNRMNVESVQYSYNYQQTANVSGLPLLPTLGVKGEF